MGPHKAGGVMTTRGTREELGTHTYSGWKQDENPAPLAGDREGQGTEERTTRGESQPLAMGARGPVQDSEWSSKSANRLRLAVLGP